MALTFLGVTGFTQGGPPRWNINGDGLDSVTIPMRGPITDLNTYLNSLTKWNAYTADTNLFLSDWDVDNHRQYPTVTLRYIGFKAGVLPAPRTSKASAIGSISKSFLGTDYNNIIHSVPSETVLAYHKTEPPRPTAGTAHAGTLAPTFGITLLKPSTAVESAGGSSWFFGLCRVQESIASFQSEEIVPGHYWRSQSTTIWTLF